MKLQGGKSSLMMIINQKRYEKESRLSLLAVKPEKVAYL